MTSQNPKMKANPIIIKKSSGPAGPGRGARVAVPGVFPSSSRFGEQVVKFRVNQLDTYIGGGVPVGSICIIRDEFPSQFGDMLLKSFVADAATYNHRLYIACENVDPAAFAQSLPSLRKGTDQNHDETSTSDLKIAWRYGQAQQESVPGSKLKTPEQSQVSFEYSKKCSVQDLGGKNLLLSKCCGHQNDDDSIIDGYKKGSKILSEIMETVNGLELENSSTSPANVARIAMSHCEPCVLSDNFLLKLRSIVQHTNSCAVITLSDLAFPVNKCDSSLLTRAEHFADIVISLRTIVDQKRRNELGGIDGVCCIRKTASNNTLKIFEPPKDVGFTFKKKRLLFHELHLPPEGENTTQREISSHSAKSNSGITTSTGSTCGSSFKGQSIDF